MEFNLLLKSFRSFSSETSIPIRPITVLVGDNSSGKSTILAALKYISQWCDGSVDASFNSDPFFLGSFRDIAHYRGGKRGRDKSFMIGITVPPQRSIRGKSPIQLELEFSDLTELKPSKISIRRENEAYDFSANSAKIVVDQETAEIPISGSVSQNAPPFDFFRQSMQSLSQSSFYLSIKEDFGSSREIAYRVRDKMIRSFRDVRQTCGRRVYASGAVRTEPHRSYDPTKSLSDAGPNTEIYRMASKIVSKTTEGDALLEDLKSFGRTSGLFQDIEFRFLGKSSSDPFQILVSTSGRKFNILDVGYGVSQILPVLYRLGEMNDTTLYLLQQPEVHLHPSVQVSLSQWVVERISRLRNGCIAIETHSDFIVDPILRAIRSKRLRPNQVSLLWLKTNGGETQVFPIDLDESGIPVDPPIDFRQFFIDELMRNILE